MSRITRTSALGIALALVGTIHAQTSARNPQRPKTKVEEARSDKEVQRDAAKIDALLARGLQRKRAEAQPLVDDSSFVRRTYLTVVGRIPTLQETERFLVDQDPDKRANLCDLLLNSPGHTSHFSNYWFDLLRVKSRQRQLSGEPFAHFIRQSVLDDVPYDQFVQQLMIAEGPAHATDNGATGHLMRDNGMPHDSMANTVRLFLGTRLECAQCHNHPFDHWTQKQYFEMAAFFGNKIASLGGDKSKSKLARFGASYAVGGVSIRGRGGRCWNNREGGLLLWRRGPFVGCGKGRGRWQLRRWQRRWRRGLFYL